MQWGQVHWDKVIQSVGQVGDGEVPTRSRKDSLGGQGAKPRKLHEAQWPPGGSTIHLATHRMGLLGSKSQLCGACSQGHTGAFLQISPRYPCTCLPSHDEKSSSRDKVPPRPQLQPGQV